MKQFTTKELIERERAETRAMTAIRTRQKCKVCGLPSLSASDICWGCQRDRQEQGSK